MMEFGMRLGLAQDMQYDQRINDLRYQNQMKKQATIEAQNKAKMFADDFDYNNAMNEFDNPLVKEFAQAKIKEIGKFINENQDWETNVGKRAQYKQLVRELKDNKDLNRGVQSDTNYKAYQKDLAEKSKNPDLYDEKAYAEIGNQWNNYLKYGNQYGQEAAKKNGKSMFVYQQPQDWTDLDAQGLDYGSKFNNFDVKSLKGGGFGAYEEVPNETSLDTLSVDFYKRNKRQMDELAPKAGYVNPLQYAKELIRPGIKTKIDYGQQWQQQSSGGAGKESSNVTGVYINDIMKAPRSIVNGDVLEKSFGNKPPLKIKNKEGEILDLSGSEIQYTGRNVYMTDKNKQNGLKSFEVIGKMTKDEAIKRQIVSANTIGDDEISNKWKGTAYFKTEKNKDGDDVEFVEWRSYADLQVNNGNAQGVYDQVSTTGKFQGDPNSSNGSGQSLSKQSLLSQGYTQEQINEAIAAGYNIQ